MCWCYILGITFNCRWCRCSWSPVCRCKYELLLWARLWTFAHLGPHIYDFLCVWCIICECLHDILWDVYHRKLVEVSVRGSKDRVCGNIPCQRQEIIRNERINLVPVDPKGNFGLPLGGYHLEKSIFEFRTSVGGVVVLFHYLYRISHIICL